MSYYSQDIVRPRHMSSSLASFVDLASKRNRRDELSFAIKARVWPCKVQRRPSKGIPVWRLVRRWVFAYYFTIYVWPKL